MKEEKEGIYWEVILTFYQLISKPHSFEVIKIELFDIQSNSSTSASSHPNSHGGLITSVVNILQNIEKSYDKGKFLLEESKKSDGWMSVFKRM